MDLCVFFEGLMGQSVGWEWKSFYNRRLEVFGIFGGVWSGFWFIWEIPFEKILGRGIWVFGFLGWVGVWGKKIFFGGRQVWIWLEGISTIFKGVLNGGLGGFDGYWMGAVGSGIVGWFWGLGDSGLVSKVFHWEIRKICFLAPEGFFVKFKKNWLSQKYTRESLAIPSKTIGRTEGPNLISPGPTVKIYRPVIYPKVRHKYSWSKITKFCNIF